jgi:DEAD/DEAH box helicase domain-containing protein
MLEYITQIHDIEINTENPLISGKHEAAAKIEEDCINYPMQKSKHFAFQDTMSMRGSAGKVDIYLDGKWIGDRTIPVGYYELHPKAIYHHRKSVYEVESITKMSKVRAKVNLKKSDEKDKSTRPIVIARLTKQLESGKKYGVIELYRIITGYYKGDYNKSTDEWEKHDGSEEKDWVNLDWSSTHMARKIELPSQFIPEDLQGKEDPGIHTIIHVFANAAKIVTKCEAIDIEAHYQDGTIYLYDNTNEGANGVSQMVDEKYDQILETCKKLLDDCDCDKREKPESGGCPKCTFTTGFCSTNNQQLDKKKAREFFNYRQNIS